MQCQAWAISNYELIMFNGVVSQFSVHSCNYFLTNLHSILLTNFEKSFTSPGKRSLKYHEKKNNKHARPNASTMHVRRTLAICSSVGKNEKCVGLPEKKTRCKSWCQNPTTRIYTYGRGGVTTCYWCQVVLSNCWSSFFSYFDKIRCMSSSYTKLLELLLICWSNRFGLWSTCSTESIQNKE
jgi:hypothetical protein